jgi:hypothetical protein
MAVTPPHARPCSPRFGRQEVREPGIELRHALLRYVNCDLLVGHLLDLGGLGSLAGGLGRSLVRRLALLGPLAPVDTHVPACVAVAAIPAAPSPATATGQEPGEERVELPHSLFGNIDRDLLILRGSRF